jgi:hypothetical protein
MLHNLTAQTIIKYLHMAYRDFKEKDLKQRFGIHKVEEPLFKDEKIEPVAPTERLLFALEDAKLITLSSEKAISERIISNVIAELKRLMPKEIQIFSGEVINGDAAQGLNGEIDYIITLNKASIEPEAPIICVCEAKIGRLNRAIPQAIAQMLGAARFNEESGEKMAVKTIHGVITDGNTWQFIRLEGKDVTIDTRLFYLNDVPALLGMFAKILNVYF